MSDIKTNMSKIINKTQETTFFERHVVWFLIYAVIVTVVAGVIMNNANSRMKECHNAVIAHQNKSVVLVDSLLAIRTQLRSDSSYIKAIPDNLAKLCTTLDNAVQTLDAHQNNERIGNLLELEFSKIQNEYEVLNLWCALLTVFFLVFSFFSIFKTNEMTKQGEDALVKLREVEREARNRSNNIDSKVAEAETAISTRQQVLLKQTDEQFAKIIKDQNKYSNEINDIYIDQIKKFEDVKSEMDRIKTDISNVNQNIGTLFSEKRKELDSYLIEYKKNLNGTIQQILDSQQTQFLSKIEKVYDLNSRIDTALTRMEIVIDKIKESKQYGDTYVADLEVQDAVSLGKEESEDADDNSVTNE